MPKYMCDNRGISGITAFKVSHYMKILDEAEAKKSVTLTVVASVDRQLFTALFTMVTIQCFQSTDIEQRLTLIYFICVPF